MRTCGRGHSALEKFCGMMSMPHPVAKPSYTALTKKLKKAAQITAEKTMAYAAHDAKEKGGTTDIGVCRWYLAEEGIRPIKRCRWCDIYCKFKRGGGGGEQRKEERNGRKITKKIVRPITADPHQVCKLKEPSQFSDAQYKNMVHITSNIMVMEIVSRMKKCRIFTTGSMSWSTSALDTTRSVLAIVFENCEQKQKVSVERISWNVLKVKSKKRKVD